MKDDLVPYLTDALDRVANGDVASPTGSWLAGVFGKAAKMFEKELASYVQGLLEACSLRYPEDLPDVVPGNPPIEKVTMGQLLAITEEVSLRQPNAFDGRLPPGWGSKDLIKQIEKVNWAWVDTKHGNEVAEDVLERRMSTMLDIAKGLFTSTKPKGPPIDAAPSPGELGGGRRGRS